jgi:RNA polymerase sigma-54 factor
MALEIRQNLKLSQQLIMTPQLQQAIKLLQFSRLELQDFIDQELESNPMLEIEQASKEKIEKPDDAENLKHKWDAYLETYGQDNIPYTEDEDRPSFEATTSRSEGLTEYLQWQLRMNDIDDEICQIGIFIIGNLDSNGYLAVDIQQICEETGATTEKADEALNKIQQFDPPGIAARNLKECLLIQSKLLGLEGSLVEQIINSHLEALQTKNYSKVAQDLGVSVNEIAEASKIITNMEPRPARDYSDDPPQYVVPDVYVVKVDDDYAVVLNEDDIPVLTLNREYYSLISSEQTNKAAKDYLSDNMKAAQWLIKSIQQRQNTLCKVTECIMIFQKEFLDKGIHYLKPLVLRDVADEVGMHESTISRVTSNKYVHTPQGTFELKYFFGSGISTTDGNFIASQSIRNDLEIIIKNENPKHPLSDQAIAKILKGKGVEIARRTVAKYRELLGILPSNKRKKYF